MSKRLSILSDSILKLAQKYSDMTHDSKYVFLRLLSRQGRPIRRNKISYLTKARTDAALNDLCGLGLISDDFDRVDETVLKSLNLRELRDFAKHFDCVSRTSSKSKKCIIEGIISLLSTSSGILSSAALLEANMKKWLVRHGTRPFTIHENIRNNFACLLICANPSLIKAYLTSQQLADNPCSQLLTTRFNARDNKGFCKISDDNYPFDDEHQLNSCMRGVIFAFRIAKLQMDKRHSDVIEVVDKELQDWMDATRRLRLTPKTRFSGCYIASKALSHSVESFESSKKYQEACSILRFLIETKFVRKRVGKWWHRLCLNQQTHLKLHVDHIKQIILDALNDEHVVLGDRLLLKHRLSRLCDGSKAELTSSTIKHVTIYGDVFNKIGTANPNQLKSQDLRNVFINRESNTNCVSYTGVEQFALSANGFRRGNISENHFIRHYLNDEEFSAGIHAEGQILQLIFGIYLIDIVFANLSPCMFFDRFQHFPIDYGMEEFIENRRELLDERMSLFEDDDQWKLKFIDNLNNYKNTNCNFVNWDIIENNASLNFEEMIGCFRGDQLRGLIDHILRHQMHCFSGVPDLLLWNTNCCTIKFVEVKGPGDKLSANQIAWIETLSDCGIDCEVLRVDMKTKCIPRKRQFKEI